MSKSILIFGSTGKQGSSVLRALLEHPGFSPAEYTILAVTRNPDSPAARRLVKLSPAIRLVQGDITDETFRKLPTEPWGVYSVTNPGAKEAQHGIAIAEAAAKVGTRRLVFSSVDRGQADGPTDVPHFITKHEIEARISELARDNEHFTYTVIRPPFFLENLQPGFFGKLVATIWRDNCPDTKLAVVDTHDIGKLAAAAFLEPEDHKYRNQSLRIAGDRITFTELDAEFVSKTGSPVPTTYSFLASMLLFVVSDVAKVVRFLREPGFAADPDQSKELLPQHHLINLERWLDGSEHRKKDQ